MQEFMGNGMYFELYALLDLEKMKWFECRSTACMLSSVRDGVRASAFWVCCGRLLWMIGSEWMSKLQYSFVNKRNSCGGGSCKTIWCAECGNWRYWRWTKEICLDKRWSKRWKQYFCRMSWLDRMRSWQRNSQINYFKCLLWQTNET